MNWKSISFEDKDFFEKQIRLKSYPLSDYNFTHMTIWKDAFRLQFAVCFGNLVVKGKDPLTDEEYIYMPMGVGNLSATIEMLRVEFSSKKSPFIIKALTPKMMSEVKSVSTQRFIFSTNRNEFEYIYKIKQISEYKDKKLRRKRELCNHFESHYIYEFIKYNTTHLPMVLDLIDKWHREREEDDGIIVESEKVGIIRLLEHIDELNCEGFILKISDEVVGFIIAEPLTDDILLVHYEKAIRTYKGVYDILKRNTARYYLSQFKFISLEEDMGIEGLRIAKELYRPNHLIIKGTINYID